MSALATLDVGGQTVTLRRAQGEDLGELVRLLANDPLGSRREANAADPDLAPYERAFDQIEADPAQLLVVGTSDGRTVATMHLTFIPGLSRRGALRAQIEAVRVDEAYRQRGLGEAMFGWAIEEARRRGCALVQLTTDKKRDQALRFYERLGFVASHEGLKLQL
jgi:ribosomal protein S18 acetylase RimI-like enzyme